MGTGVLSNISIPFPWKVINWILITDVLRKILKPWILLHPELLNTASWLRSEHTIKNNSTLLACQLIYVVYTCWLAYIWQKQGWFPICHKLLVLTGNKFGFLEGILEFSCPLKALFFCSSSGYAKNHFVKKTQWFGTDKDLEGWKNLRMGKTGDGIR